MSNNKMQRDTNIVTICYLTLNHLENEMKYFSGLKYD